MDLYKWAFKLAPFTPAELTADCFELARDIREVDMRASPYDLERLGFAPIPIETPEGRAAYEVHQRDFATRAQPLRARLIALLERLRGHPALRAIPAIAVSADAMPDGIEKVPSFGAVSSIGAPLALRARATEEIEPMTSQASPCSSRL